MDEKYRVVNTDNFGADYPDERFVGPEYDTKGEAQSAATRLNILGGPCSSRFYKVVELPYKLQPGFTP